MEINNGMDWGIVIQNILTVLGGGIVGSFFTYKLGKKKQDNNDFISIISEHKQLLEIYKEEYKTEVVELRKKLESVELKLIMRDAEITQLRNQLMIFESSHSDIPIPVWLKDTDGKMLFLNEEYEKAILQPLGKTRNDYIGKTDIEVWGDDIGSNFLEHDKQIIRGRRSIQFEEVWPGANEVFYTGKVIKYPRFLGRTVIGIGGVIVDINEKHSQ